MLNFFAFSYLVDPLHELIRTGTAVVASAFVEFENVKEADEDGTNTEDIVNLFLSLGMFDPRFRTS